jgi:MFS superfamily sulfate permease-like transporter
MGHLIVTTELHPAATAATRVEDADLSPAMRFDLAEAAGGLGDLGVFIPLLAGMVNRCGLQLGPALLLAGAMNVLTGLLFHVPMPVQPMKAIAAVAISEGLTEAQVLEAGILSGAVVLLLALAGSIDWLNRRVPAVVVRGLQLALGLKLLIEGLGLVVGTQGFWGWDSVVVGLLCAAIAVGLRRSTRLPAALAIFALGLIALLAAHPLLVRELRFGFQWRLPALGTLNDWKVGLWQGALPQIPLTLLNSVVAVCALSADLFPRVPVQPKRVAVSVALMNLVCCPFGGMPMCHGAGGLAGQYRFGARTGGSIVMLGGAKILLALLFGGSLWLWLQHYPHSVLGVLLVCGGVELAMVCRDQTSLRSLTVMGLTAIACLTAGMGIGFLAGWLLALVLNRVVGWKGGKEKTS